MMFDTYAHHGQSLGQSFAQPFGQPIGVPFGQPYGLPFGQPYGPQFGQPSGQTFGPLAGQLFGQPYAQPFGQQTVGIPPQVAQLAALQSLCAQLGPLAALQVAGPQLAGALTQPGMPHPFASLAGGWHGQPGQLPLALQALCGQLATGIQSPLVAQRVLSGIGPFSGGFGPVPAQVPWIPQQPAYVG